MTIPNNREATDIGYALRQSQERVQNALNQERVFLIEISDRIVDLSEKYQSGDQCIQQSSSRFWRFYRFYD